jgi:hypothetical protein
MTMAEPDTEIEVHDHGGALLKQAKREDLGFELWMPPSQTLLLKREKRFASGRDSRRNRFRGMIYCSFSKSTLASS